MSAPKKCLGVDIGVNSVKIVEVSLEASGVRVVRSASASTGTNSYASAEDQRAAIVKAVKEAYRSGRFSTKYAVFSLSGQKAFFRRFTVPKTTDERLKRLIQYEAREQIPFPLDKATVQYEIRPLGNRPEVEVLLSAVRNDEIREHMQILNKTGLTAIGIGTSSFSLYSAHRVLSMRNTEFRKLVEANKTQNKFTLSAIGIGAKKKPDAKGPAVAEEEDEEDRPAVIQEEFSYDEVKGLVNLGASSFDVAIARLSGENSSLGFCRTVLSGGDAMTRQVLNALQLESFEDAEAIKTSSTRIQTFAAGLEEDDGQYNEEACKAVSAVADKISNEIRRTLEYFLSQRDGMAIDTLVVSGGVANLPGLDSLLEEKLAVPVTILNELPEGSVVSWTSPPDSIAPYAVAVGLGLQGLGVAPIKIDFLPEERKIIRDFPYLTTAVLASLVLATTTLAALSGQPSIAQFNEGARSIEERLNLNQGRVAAFQDAQALHDQTADQIRFMGQMFGQRDFWFNFVSRIAAIKPREVVITDILMGHDGAVRITAIASSNDPLTDFNNAINRVFADELEGTSTIEEVTRIPQAIPPFQGGAQQMRYSLMLKTKHNHLQITPTPSPTPVGGFGGQRGFFGGPGGGAGARF